MKRQPDCWEREQRAGFLQYQHQIALMRPVGDVLVCEVGELLAVGRVAEEEILAAATAAVMGVAVGAGGGVVARRWGSTPLLATGGVAFAVAGAAGSG